MTKLKKRLLFVLPVPAALSLFLVSAAIAEVPSEDVPAGLRAAIQADVESRGQEYAGLCRDVPDDGSAVGKYCAVVLELGAESAQVGVAPYPSGDFRVFELVLRNGAWGIDQGSPGSGPTPTRSPTREWSVEGVKVEGTTVTVRLRVFAGIDVGVTLHGQDPDEKAVSLPYLDFIFRAVPPGAHEAVVKDVVGFREAITFTVASRQDGSGSLADVPSALRIAIRAEVERRGHPYAGLCREVPDDGSGIGKYCANIVEVGTDMADIAFGPYATNELTAVRLVMAGDAWKVSVPGPPRTGTGRGALGPTAGLISNLLVATAICVVLGAGWMLGRTRPSR